jgi:hypothetical protein
MKNKLFLGVLFGAVLICGSVLFAQRPVTNIDPNKHPNLAEAQHFIQQAYEKAEEAQKGNKKDELGGHAEKAKQHLVEADQELKLAAEYADHRK